MGSVLLHRNPPAEFQLPGESVGYGARARLTHPTRDGRMDAGQLEARKTRARAWFESLRDDICAAFEGLEDGLPAGAPRTADTAGRFVRTPWARPAHSGAPGGGGVMSILKGRVF